MVIFLMKKIGRVIHGSMEGIEIRKIPHVKADIGEIICIPNDRKIFLYQIYDIEHRSMMSSKDIEFCAYNLDTYNDIEIYDRDQRYYEVLYAKPLVEILLDSKDYSFVKSLPKIFTEVYKIDDEIGKKIVEIVGEGLDIGMLRSGSEVLKVPIPFDINEAINHHILIAATTGRGKSNLLRVLLWKMMYSNNVGLLVMDPHDEYVTPTKYSLAAHPNAQTNLLYYSSTNKSFFANSHRLLVDISLLKPHHFLSVFNFSEPQMQAMYLAYQERNKEWIKELIMNEEFIKKLVEKGVKRETCDVLRRKLMFHLNIALNKDDRGNAILIYNSIFREGVGERFVEDILSSLENGKIVVLDTSELTSSEELLVMSLLSHGIFDKYKYYKKRNELYVKAKIGIVLEEAPRVLNNVLLSNEGSIFGIIAREGRKFNIGLIAITQLPSLIPNEILSNMNTKIILGIEMQKERNIIINSSPQDLSKDDKIIASLNKGEAIITSIFTPFPIPLRVHFFDELVDSHISTNTEETKESFSAFKQGYDDELDIE